MTDVTGGPAYQQDNPEVRSAVLHDRRRPGRREVAPELIPLLRGQVPVLAEPNVRVVQDFTRPASDDLAGLSGVMRGLCIASLGWAAVGFLVLY